MSSDEIVKRLRQSAFATPYKHEFDLLIEAADKFERMQEGYGDLLQESRAVIELMIDVYIEHTLCRPVDLGEPSITHSRPCSVALGRAKAFLETTNEFR